MPRTENRLTWIQQSTAPDDIHVAECGPYVFEISLSKEPGTGHVLQVWQTRPEDWPLLVWELDGFSLAEAKARAERLADERVPFIIEG
jgi:hypothetical protein